MCLLQYKSATQQTINRNTKAGYKKSGNSFNPKNQGSDNGFRQKEFAYIRQPLKFFSFKIEHQQAVQAK